MHKQNHGFRLNLLLTGFFGYSLTWARASNRRNTVFIFAVDRNLGRLLNVLDELGISDDTIVRRLFQRL